jgi:hypothetical protein
MQWAHLASGGAGGGLRWPNRKPHCLTSGMRRAQRALANFLPLLDWTRLRRRPLDITLLDGHGRLAAFGCGDEDQAVLWLLRTDTIGNDGMLRQDPAPLAAEVIIRSLRPGEYRVTPYDTRAGKPLARPAAARAADGSPRLAAPAIETDLAFALRKL